MNIQRQGYYARDEDYYVILGVDFKATKEEIALAYKKLAKKFHPDKNNHDDRSRREAQVIFEKIKTAYDVLGDPRKRSIYDTLGPEGLKLDGWMVTNKLMTAEEIREEFKRLQKQNEEINLNITAKPRTSFTVSVDASDLFASKIEDDVDEDEDEETISSLIPSLEITSMAASMGFDHHIAKNHDLSLTGGLNVKNGTGDGVVGLLYTYKYSPDTAFDLMSRFGNGPLLSVGLAHQINKKTSISTRGFLFIDTYTLVPGLKISLSHRIRNYLTGKITYKEGIDPSVTAALIYLNEKLMLQLTTSYKLSRLHQRASMELGYNFNNNRSKLSVTVAVCEKSGLEVEYGCETRVLEINSIGAALAISLPNGITLKIRYSRANQEFNIPIYLSDEVSSPPVFYGTMVPLITFYLWDRFYLRQYKKLAN